MLVKLGDVWVDPHKVEAISSDGVTKLQVSGGMYYPLGISPDECATVINDYSNQSFGGEDETPTNA